VLIQELPIADFQLPIGKNPFANVLEIGNWQSKIGNAKAPRCQQRGAFLQTFFERSG
jgi:hypothetical protein